MSEVLQSLITIVAQAASQSIESTTTLVQEATNSAAPALTEMAGVVQEQPGMLEFIAQSDLVGKALFVILVLMSLTSWYLIFVKTITNWRIGRRSERFLQQFWAASSLEQVENEIATHGANEPFSHLASHAIHARNHHEKYGAVRL
ncbi:MAG TPA: flagellar motor protein MotA, partial [Pusillimonas sp.]|nr:flagellar motor protein MotA [Pusillimonas sp.]